MKSARFALSAAVLLVLCAPMAMAQEKAASPEKLGNINFPVSCNPSAQAQFSRAAAMLHSFWFPQAPKAFAEVIQTDPACAMAYWGIAISQRANPLVGPPDTATLKRGWESVAKAKEIGAKTQREKDYIGAIELYYKDSDELDHRTRVLAYEKAMEQLYLRYPGDMEAAVFYALTLNEAADLKDTETDERQMQNTSVVEAQQTLTQIE